MLTSTTPTTMPITPLIIAVPSKLSSSRVRQPLREERYMRREVQTNGGHMNEVRQFRDINRGADYVGTYPMAYTLLTHPVPDVGHGPSS